MYPKIFTQKFSDALIFTFFVGVIALSGCASGASSNDVKTSAYNTSSESSDSSEIAYVNNRSKAHVTRTGEVYLMRGLLNVFSRGMDTMASQMRARGLDAISYNHSNWKPVADDIVARSKTGDLSYPIIIMGHSLGGNEAPNMANYLVSKGIKIAEIVTFDPTETRSVGKGIGTVVNYYLPNGKNTISRGRGFSGKLTNVNVSGIPNIKHTTVEKTPKLQAQAIKSVMDLTKPLPKKSRKKRISKRKKKVI